jgi:hypothetical protein
MEHIFEENADMQQAWQTKVQIVKDCFKLSKDPSKELLPLFHVMQSAFGMHKHRSG